MKEETGKLISKAVLEGAQRGFGKVWWIIALLLIAGIVIRILEDLAHKKIDDWKRKRR